ncbi:MAG: orotidine 5'-phosphate decarboxylase / HUMPS family protein [Candidatus Omnitrophota bacterium]|nr:orotidine 5'-phosphate decarboxylase / HUMPS family protein [Candidatus Omnitrophota bacterium]
MKNKLIVALDVDRLKKANELVNTLYPKVEIFKVGSQLFTSSGPEIIKSINKKGGKEYRI